MIKHLLSIFSGRKQPGIAGLGDSLLPKLIFDRETLRILAVNKAAVALYGYSEDEFLVMTIREIRPVWELQKLARHINEQQLRGKNTGIWKHLKKNGDIILVHVEAEDVEFADKSQRLVTVHDITPPARGY